MNVSDITITSLETITAFNLTSGAYMFTMDELQNATLSQSEEKAEIVGKKAQRNGVDGVAFVFDVSLCPRWYLVVVKLFRGK